MGSGVGRILVTESGREGPGPWSGAHSVHGSGGEGYWGKSQKLKKGKKGKCHCTKIMAKKYIKKLISRESTNMNGLFKVRQCPL